MKRFTTVVVFIILCEMVGILSTPFTVAAIPTWYAGLEKPFFSPPNWIFGPVWTTLYALMGIAAFLVWEKGHAYRQVNHKHKKVRHALHLFAIQLLLNFLWSFLFFGLHPPLLALIDIGALLYAIILTIIAFKKVTPTAAYLLLPYLLWVSFASILNLAIVVLNK